MNLCFKMEEVIISPILVWIPRQINRYIPCNGLVLASCTWLMGYMVGLNIISPISPPI